MPETTYPGEVLRAFAEVARRLAAAKTVDDTLRAVVHLAEATIPGCEYAGVSLVDAGGGATRVATQVATHDVVSRCDASEYELGEGPCLETVWEHDILHSQDLAEERRWPNWAPRAVELGVASLLSFPLFTAERTLGTLNLYSREPNAFDDADREIGVVFAAHAAVALSGAQDQARIDAASVVNQAMGMLMERRDISSAQALDILRRAAQRLEVRLHEMAERVVGEGPHERSHAHTNGVSTIKSRMAERRGSPQSEETETG